MKIFALYLRLYLTAKPEWFDSFRAKYASRSILHITLIQPRYVDESRIQDLKDKVASGLRGIKFNAEDKKLVFDKTEVEREEEGTSLFMWFIKENKSIIDLQKGLVEELKDFSDYCVEVTRGYESNFRPHITVADEVESDVNVAELLSKDSKCEGVITDLVLPVVKDKSVEESENPANFTLFGI